MVEPTTAGEEQHEPRAWNKTRIAVTDFCLATRLSVEYVLAHSADHLACPGRFPCGVVERKMANVPFPPSGGDHMADGQALVLGIQNNSTSTTRFQPAGAAFTPAFTVANNNGNAIVGSGSAVGVGVRGESEFFGLSVSALTASLWA
jgi:hypothetical protein